MLTNERTTPIRRILVPFEAAAGNCLKLDRAAEIACRERATIDLCGLVRKRSALLFLAMMGGVTVMPDQLEAEEMEQLAEEMRVAVADLPRDLGVRRFMLVGNPRRKVAELLRAGEYDLVV